jgi:hypothetical protein
MVQSIQRHDRSQQTDDDQQHRERYLEQVSRTWRRIDRNRRVNSSPITVK